MVNFTILMLLCLITESAGIQDDDININSRLKLKPKQNGGSKLAAIGFDSFPILCRTLLKRCRKICYKLKNVKKCYNFCFQTQEICTN